MEALSQRKIKDGADYNHLFPSAEVKNKTVKKSASVDDTVKFIPKVVRETLYQTEGIANQLKAGNLNDTCKRIWQFCYDHIRYNKDEEGKEQIRAPSRTWHDRSRGVDCDCFTVFISSILTNLNISHSLRIAKYRKDYFQHIYPIVHRPNGKYNTIDCVVDHYNYEEPYTEIKDTKMDLQYLSGIEDEFGGYDSEESLGKRKGKGKLKEFIKKGLHVTNRANPATLLLRNGVLASMKLNILKVAQRLKYAYMSDEDAKKKGVDMNKHAHLRKIKDKLEIIFYGAGGKPENLRKAILTGRGNKNHDVAGLGDMNEATTLRELLGTELFLSENSESLGELGEPVTAASITAATGAIAAIAALLKSVGNIFPKKDKKSPESKDFQTSEADTDPKNVQNEIEQNKTEIMKLDASAKTVDASASTSATSSTDSSGSGDGTQQGFWDKNKKWIKPSLIGATGLGLLYLGYNALHKKEEKPKALSGTKSKSKHEKKGPVALM